MEELLDLTNPFNFDNNSSSSAEQKLPRIADLPLPAPMPEWFAKEYATECRSVKAMWNVLYRHVPAEQFYKVKCQKFIKNKINRILLIFPIPFIQIY
jgi:hypothetical protein